MDGREGRRELVSGNASLCMCSTHMQTINEV